MTAQEESKMRNENIAISFRYQGNFHWGIIADDQKSMDNIGEKEDNDFSISSQANKSKSKTLSKSGESPGGKSPGKELPSSRPERGD